jgi:hypothetical protein
VKRLSCPNFPFVVCSSLHTMPFRGMHFVFSYCTRPFEAQKATKSKKRDDLHD